MANRIVYYHNGSWFNKKEGAKRATSAHSSVEQATVVAKMMLRRSGGGELIIIDINGNEEREKISAPQSRFLFKRRFLKAKKVKKKGASTTGPRRR